MIGNKKVLAIIPARGGSKGLPRKNIRIFNGQPLIAWSIQQAIGASYLDSVLVSTDDHEIADVARGYSAEVPFIRPAALATDTASVYDVIEHAAQYYSSQESKQFDYVILLEPTSPLRSSRDIERAIELLDNERENFDALVTLGEVNQHPNIIKKIDKKRVVPYCPDLENTGRRQDNDSAYFPFGAVYAAKLPELLARKTFYMERCIGMEIERSQCYEIDDLYDFICAERVMQFEQE